MTAAKNLFDVATMLTKKGLRRARGKQATGCALYSDYTARTQSHDREHGFRYFRSLTIAADMA